MPREGSGEKPFRSSRPARLSPHHPNPISRLAPAQPGGGARSPKVTNGQGLGLGLYITRKIVTVTLVRDRRDLPFEHRQALFPPAAARAGESAILPLRHRAVLLAPIAVGRNRRSLAARESCAAALVSEATLAAGRAGDGIPDAVGRRSIRLHAGADTTAGGRAPAAAQWARTDDGAGVADRAGTRRVGGEKAVVGHASQVPERAGRRPWWDRSSSRERVGAGPACRAHMGAPEGSRGSCPRAGPHPCPAGPRRQQASCWSNRSRWRPAGRSPRSDERSFALGVAPPRCK